MQELLHTAIGKENTHIVLTFVNALLVVSLGVDCGTADFLRQNGMRKQAFPFDWAVTPSSEGLVQAFQRNFQDWYVQDPRIPAGRFIINKYGVQFHHNFFEWSAMNERYQRRVERLRMALGTNYIQFVRASHNTYFCKATFPCNTDRDEVLDMQQLDVFLRKQHGSSFKIWLFLCCHHCHKGIRVPRETDTLKVINLVPDEFPVEKDQVNNWFYLHETLKAMLPRWQAFI